MKTSLNSARRARDLTAVADGEVVDLLVVGGGVTGAGVALDAASRGLSVCLLESRDLAFGTSRWSSKLVHGGLRYLARGQVGLARESAVERGVLMTRTAPHLVRALPQLVPLHGSDRGLLVMAGLRAGDALRRAARTPSHVLPAPRRVPAAEAVALVPGLLSFDGQLVDDARLVVALARTAAGFGARVLTGARVTALHRGGAHVVDEIGGEDFEVRARAVVNATGVWAGGLAEGVRLRPSRGSHLVLTAEAVGLTGTALTIPAPDRPNSYVLLLPQLDGRVYLGLTDEPVDGPIPDVPEVPRADVDLLLGVASSVLRQRLSPDDVIGGFAGLRPLIDVPGGRTTELSREHAVLPGANGVITVIGGKLTTYRRMAADAVDTAIRERGLAAGPSRTADLPLVGAGTPAGPDTPARLAARYGVEADRIAALGDLDPELARPVAGEITAAEVVWAVRHEGALNADDVLDRRTRIGLVPAERAAAEPAVTDLVARTLAGLHG